METCLLARPFRAGQLSLVCAILVSCLLLTPAAVARGLSVGPDETDCIDSFLAYLEGRGSLRPEAGGLLLPEQRADCVDFFAESLAGYESGYRTERGNKLPPPPPPPAPGTPPGRYWHAFAGNGSDVPDAARLYLFGGSGGADLDWQILADLWYYRADQGLWYLVPTGTNAPARRQHMGFSCGAGQCVVTHGTNGVTLKDTWIYSEGSGAWSEVNCRRYPCPAARMMPTMAYDPSRAYHVLFGGLPPNTVASSSLADTWTFAGGRWTVRTPPTVPHRRDRAAAAFAPAAGSRVVMHGGQFDDLRGGVLCDMYAWSGTNWVAINMTNTGPCLHSHSMAWDGGKLVVTGGYVDTSDTPNARVFHFTFSSPTSGYWSQDSGSAFATCAAGADPGARAAHDAASGQIAFFGGLYNIKGTGSVATDTFVTCP